ncbi:EAL domain-containing protein [Reinekea marinisedimentorum]|uniref:PAS domain S-box-containing protein/diguanylate cyclase (GGDEF)-like protein n=1 Tax=Reinekea marinisedimentorum TaxID=230495 RepID=A0A4R3I3N4_9GAMM|nr:EAL domain-containing protein [Reinekea marinisedimentorum]TCS40444.1 PAS domain S-box-containing protein/diguanylate cyclase (GGDEF)-like protein [Reinekea marinisedimentorum]
MRILNKLTTSGARLHTKLTLALAFLITLVVTGATVLLIDYERELRFNELVSRADRIAELTSRSLAYTVWNIDRDTLADQLVPLSLVPDIIEFSVTATGYGVLHEFKKTAPAAEQDLFTLTKDISFATADSGTQLIGQLHMVFTRAVTDRATREAFHAIWWLVGVILVVLYVATYLLLQRMVSSRVHRLKAMVDRIAKGDFDARCEVESLDELGQLAVRVNVMAKQLSVSDRQLRDNEENLAITLNSIGDGVIATDAYGNVTRMNPEAELLTGWAQQDAQGLPLEEVFQIRNSVTGEASINPVQKVFERGDVVGLANDTVLTSRNGVEYQIADSAAPIRKAEGEIVGVVLVFSDVSEQYRVNRELALTQVHMQALLDAIPDILFEVNRSGRILSYHTHRTDLLIQRPEDFVGKLISEVLPPEPAAVAMAAIEEAAAKGNCSGSIYSLELPDGTVWFELSIAAMKSETAGEGPENERFTVLSRDVTERMQADAKLKLAASVFVNAGEGIMIVDTNKIIVDVNRAFTKITGYSWQDAVGQKTSLLKSGRHDAAFYRAMWKTIHRDGQWSGEIWNRRKNGEEYAELLTISAIHDEQDNIQQFVGLFTDITDIKTHQTQLEYIAHFDSLTGLPNRTLLADRLHQAMAQTMRRKKQLAVAFLDLDGFKEINDSYTHETGDQVLVTLTQRMKDTLREGDTLARLGGDEFVAVLIDLDGPSDSLPLIKRLLGAAAQPMQIGANSLQVTASLGVTFYPQTPGMDADQLLRQADQAMYQAKLAGKNRYSIFDAAQDSSLRWYHESLERIQQALDNNEFVLHYQPKVNMRTGQVIGAEALIRWQHPEKGLLAPAAFLPTIEDHPLAVSVGEWVINSALTQLETWHKRGLALPEVSVNVGARQLQQHDFLERLKFILRRHRNVAPGSLQIEVLETSALADIAQVSRLIEDCANIGISFALDDFGTGYSSLTYLKRLNVAMLKIDQSFVRDMLDDPDDLAILQGVIGLARAFKRNVIAEGVETIEHGTELLKLGCEYAQGYGIARPMPGCELAAWAEQWHNDARWSRLKQLSDTFDI